MGKVSFLHTNDLHGAMSPELAEKLRPLREKCDLYFDTGDCIKTGNLGIPLSPDPVWGMLSELKITASVLGNRETHPVNGVFLKKIVGAQQDILVANMSGTGRVIESKLLQVSDIKVGVFGVMVPMCTEQKRDKALWAHRWTQPIPEAVRLAKQLRAQCDLLIALTHIGYQRDIELAKAAPEIDIIFGGHSHTVLPTPHVEGTTYIGQGGSHGRFAGVYEWENGVLTGELVPLKDSR